MGLLAGFGKLALCNLKHVLNIQFDVKVQTFEIAASAA
jgi:hypothetical protein